MLINAFEISLKYLDKVLFKDSSFVINDFDKIGLVGINGVGKSSLIKALIGDVQLDSGIISKKKDLKIGYLPQNDDFNEDDTIIDTILKRAKISDFEAKTILSKVGLTDYTKTISTLSGGERKRLGLSIAISLPVDLLILDEPTNHLDIWMINWLEQYLKKYNHALLLVTHDRYFLERVTNKIMEIDHHDIYMYDEKYSGFLTRKAERMEALKATNRKLSALFKKEAVWASLNPQARSTKSKERLEKFKALEETLANSNKELNQKYEFELSSLNTRMGKTTIEINNISQKIANKVLFSDFSYNLNKRDRLGIVGENGCGKTTLFKTILGELLPTTGSVTIGKTIKIGYFKQHMIIKNDKMRLIDYIKEFGEYLDTTNGMVSASQLLEDYLFSKDQQYSYINKLSGGEKRRLQLVSVLITNPNVLFLDEPTNDLDIYTLEILEQYLENFKGAVVVVSHDRYFLDKVADHLMVIDNGQINEYNGIVSDYITNNPKMDKAPKQNIKKDPITEQIPRFTSKEKKEFDTIDDVIAQIETKINDLTKEKASITSDYLKLIEIDKQIEILNIELEQKLERWTYLNELNEQILLYKERKYRGEL